jgi:hypothetical protein
VAGTITAGFLGQAIGIIPVLAAQGAGYVAAGLLVVVALRRRDLAASEPEPDPGQPAPAPLFR